MWLPVTREDGTKPLKHWRKKKHPKIDYWTNDIMGNRDGKLKSIGDIKIDHFTNDIFGIRVGKVKSMGDITISYWTNDINGRNGLIRSIEGHSPEVFVTIQ